jgi:hypothetical protein
VSVQDESRPESFLAKVYLWREAAKLFELKKTKGRCILALLYDKVILRLKMR